MAEVITCPICKGRGLVGCPREHGFLGPSLMDCDICKGKGTVLCQECGGAKKIVVRSDRNTKR